MLNNSSAADECNLIPRRSTPMINYCARTLNFNNFYKLLLFEKIIIISSTNAIIIIITIMTTNCSQWICQAAAVVYCVLRISLCKQVGPADLRSVRCCNVTLFAQKMQFSLIHQEYRAGISFHAFPRRFWFSLPPLNL